MQSSYRRRDFGTPYNGACGDGTPYDCAGCNASPHNNKRMTYARAGDWCFGLARLSDSGRTTAAFIGE